MQQITRTTSTSGLHSAHESVRGSAARGSACAHTSTRARSLRCRTDGACYAGHLSTISSCVCYLRRGDRRFSLMFRAPKLSGAALPEDALSAYQSVFPADARRLHRDQGALRRECTVRVGRTASGGRPCVHPLWLSARGPTPARTALKAECTKIMHSRKHRPEAARRRGASAPQQRATCQMHGTVALSLATTRHAGGRARKGVAAGARRATPSRARGAGPRPERVRSSAGGALYMTHIAMNHADAVLEHLVHFEPLCAMQATARRRKALVEWAMRWPSNFKQLWHNARARCESRASHAVRRARCVVSTFECRALGRAQPAGVNRARAARRSPVRLRVRAHRL